MDQKTRSAWIEAAKEQVLANAKKTDGCEAELMMLYDECAYALEKEVRAFYQKFAKENSLSETEAAKLLSGKEWSRFRKTLEGYVSEIEESGKDSKIAMELNTLSAKSQLSRKEALLANIYHNMADLSGKSEKALSGLLSDLVRTNFERKSYDIQSLLKVGFPAGKIDEELLLRILGHPWSGENYSKRIWNNTDKLAALARREIAYGFLSGSSVDKMTDIIAKEMESGRYQARRLVRTESVYFANQGQMLAYQRAGIKKYRWLGGGCEDCARFNGMVFDVDAAVAGENLPPLHPNCKCTTIASSDIPVFKKRYADPLKDNPKFAEWKKRYQEEDDAYEEDDARERRKRGFFAGLKAKQEAKKLLKPYAENVTVRGEVNLENYKKMAAELENQFDKLHLSKLSTITVFDSEENRGRLGTAGGKGNEFYLRVSTDILDHPEVVYQRCVLNWKEKIEKLMQRNRKIRRTPENVSEVQQQYADLIEMKKYVRSNVFYEGRVIEALIQHETMHLQIRKKQMRNDKRLAECYNKAIETGDIYSISYRAAYNEQELMAEAAIMLENGEPLPDYIRALLGELRS